MKLRLATLVLMLALAAPAASAQCAMCYESASQASQKGQKAMTRAVLVLLMPPVGFMSALIGVVLYRRKST